jgi:ABC-type Fe3+ transport system permease subunit
MFPITNQTLIGAIRSGMLVGWLALFKYLTEADWLNEYVAIQEFLDDLNGFVAGTLILAASATVGAAIWAGVTKVAAWRGQGGLKGLLGSLASYAFAIPVTPAYDV